jgi:urease accessory protein
VSPLQQLQWLQLCDSAFPIGAFSYSEGLEAAVHSGSVQHPEDLRRWMQEWIHQVFRTCDGPALVQVRAAWEQADLERLRQLDHELTALRPAEASRVGSVVLGKRLLKAVLPLGIGAGLVRLEALLNSGELSGNHLLVWAVVSLEAGWEPGGALNAYAYQRLNGMISAALRLFGIGQQAGQQVLAQTLLRVPEAVAEVLQSPFEPLRAFSPWQDQAQMNHRFLYTRLFRS